jgi:ABC-type polysaccharide/polyol phosphate export permease
MAAESNPAIPQASLREPDNATTALYLAVAGVMSACVLSTLYAIARPQEPVVRSALNLAFWASQMSWPGHNQPPDLEAAH